MERKYAEFAATKACELLAIDSPSGYTRKAADWVKEAFSSLGFDAQLTTKGGVRVNLGGADEKDALLLEAHTDTLGAMVAEDQGERKTPAHAARRHARGKRGDRKCARPYQNRQNHRGHGAAVQRLGPCERAVRRDQAQLRYRGGGSGRGCEDGGRDARARRGGRRHRLL